MRGCALEPLDSIFLSEPQDFRIGAGIELIPKTSAAGPVLEVSVLSPVGILRQGRLQKKTAPMSESLNFSDGPLKLLLTIRIPRYGIRGDLATLMLH